MLDVSTLYGGLSSNKGAGISCNEVVVCLDVVFCEAGGLVRAQSAWSDLGNCLPWIVQYALIYLHWIDAFLL